MRNRTTKFAAVASALALTLADCVGGNDDGFDQLGSDASATANLLDDNDTYQIALDNTDLPDPSPEDADLELWLIEVGDDGGIVDLVSLGIVEDADQAFAVPAGIDPAAYSVVDISVEPHDGDHDHSGRSILRGQLSA
jgi:anti-sigma-K factor RskA